MATLHAKIEDALEDVQLCLNEIEDDITDKDYEEAKDKLHRLTDEVATLNALLRRAAERRRESAL